MPVSWIEHDVEVTIVEMRDLGTEVLGIRQVEPGYYLVGVQVTLKNLRHEAHSLRSSLSKLILSKPYFELMTSRANLYKGEVPIPDYAVNFRPEEVQEFWDYFEIRLDEKPMELRMYEDTDPAPYSDQLRIAQTWNVK